MTRKLVYGVGVNDADYNVCRTEIVDGKKKQLWMCPFYRKWRDMLQRCYSEVLHHRFPTYIGCSVVPEWHYFMTFRAWMIEQDWEGNQLDKDLLVRGNKIYGPDTCLFVGARVNTFLTECESCRGEWPLGVYKDKQFGKFKAQAYSVETGKNIGLGYYLLPQEAHQAWLTFKLEQAKILASKQSDPRIAKAIVERYENYAI